MPSIIHSIIAVVFGRSLERDTVCAHVEPFQDSSSDELHDHAWTRLGRLRLCHTLVIAIDQPACARFGGPETGEATRRRNLHRHRGREDGSGQCHRWENRRKSATNECRGKSDTCGAAGVTLTCGNHEKRWRVGFARIALRPVRHE